MSPATRFVQVAENRAGAGAVAAVNTLLRLLPGWGVLVVAGESDPPPDGRWDATVDRVALAKAGAEYAGYFAAGAEKVVRVRAADKYLTHAMLMAQRALAALPGALLLAGSRQDLTLAPALRLMVSGGIGEEWDAGARELRPLIDLTVVNLPGAAEQPIADDINPCAFADLSAKAELPRLREWLARRVGA
jgi:hypothetical protein